MRGAKTTVNNCEEKIIIFRTKDKTKYESRKDWMNRNKR